MKKTRILLPVLLLTVVLALSGYIYTIADTDETTITQDTQNRQGAMHITLKIEADPEMPYMAWRDASNDLILKTLLGVRYTVIDSATTLWSDQIKNGWYVAAGDVTIDSRVEVVGTVNLILCDGATLTVPKGISVIAGTTLNIYGQNGGTGALIIDNVDDKLAGIGGDSSNNSGGTITIHGGNITTTGGRYGAGIGGSRNASGDYGGANGPVSIYGGTVTANGGEGAAGIGGGYRNSGAGSKVTINSGIVCANGGEGAAGIGGGSGNASYGKGCSVTINGGTVTTVGGGEGSRGIGAGVGCSDTLSGTITVSRNIGLCQSDTPGFSGISDDYNSVRYRYMSAISIHAAASTYIDAEGEVSSRDDSTLLEDGSATAWNGGWYSVGDNVTITGSVTINGTVNLILADGVTLTVSKGISGGVLNIYGQRRGTGKLKTTGYSGAGISSDVNLYGGNVNAVGSSNEAGILGAVTVYGGTVNAAGGTNGAGIAGNVILEAGKLNAVGNGSGNGIDGSMVTVDDGIMNAIGYIGINASAVRVENGSLVAYGDTVGISESASLSVSSERLLQGGANSDGSALIPISVNERRPYMKAAEQVFTIFYKDEKAGDSKWTIPCCTYTYAGGSATEAMEWDGMIWRLSVQNKPLTVNFFDAEPQTTTDEVDASEETPTPRAGEITGERSVSEFFTLNEDDPVMPAGTTVAGFGTFFVIKGGCRVITFVDWDRTWYVVVPEGGVVECPDYTPDRGEDYTFFGWISGYEFRFGCMQQIKYNFGETVKQSQTVTASYYRNQHRVTFQNSYYSSNVRTISVGAGLTLTPGDAGDVATLPPENTGLVFNGWVVAKTAYTRDSEGNQITLHAGSKWDFSYPVIGDLHLKTSWLHVHNYGAPYSFADHVGFYQSTDPGHVQMNNTIHYRKCIYCGHVISEPHTFDENEHCIKCGVTVDHTVLHHVITIAQSLSGNKVIADLHYKEGSFVYYPFYAPTGDDGLRVALLIYDNTDPENPVLMKSIPASGSLSAYVDRPLKLVMTYRNRYEFDTRIKVKLTTTAGASGYSNMEVNWRLPSGYRIVDAGIMTTTNKELKKKYAFSVFTPQAYNQNGLDISNLLKRRQSDRKYESGRRTDVKNHMISGASYDPNTPATIHEFHTSNLSREGSYTVPHQLPTGQKADNYGPWVYAMGYVVAVDLYGNQNTYYTDPVAVSVNDISHTAENVFDQ